MDVGLCRALVQRVSYTGDLGYEIYVPAEDQFSLYETLTAAGDEFGLKPFGMRAMMSLRLEKSFGSWLREFKPDYTPVETGLDRFVAYNKPADFIGKAAALKEKAEGVKRRLSTFVVDAKDADVWGDEPIWLDGKSRASSPPAAMRIMPRNPSPWASCRSRRSRTGSRLKSKSWANAVQQC